MRSSLNTGDLGIEDASLNSKLRSLKFRSPTASPLVVQEPLEAVQVQ